MSDLSPDQINAAVNHTSAAIEAAKLAWADWAGVLAVVYPILVHAAAWFKGLQKVPGLNILVGNYGAAKNKE